MTNLTHFPSALLSNWQSAIAKVAAHVSSPAGAALSSAHLAPPVVNFQDRMIAAGQAVALAQFNAAPGKPAVALVQPVERCAAAAFDLAKAKIDGNQAAATAAAAQLAAYGNCDPRWAETVTEFVAHFTLAKHGDVPYKRWKSLSDFVLPDPNNGAAPPVLPAQCKIAVIGDWGTGAQRANDLLRNVAKLQPDLLIHLGDIYYSCTATEANAFYDNCGQAFAGNPPPIFTLCGNHDMYAGGAPYYALLDRLNQPASFFCLRNQSWQILALDTGYNDFDPTKVDTGATWVQDNDDPNDPYSELAWHADKLQSAQGKLRTIVLSHHQLFTFNAPIAKTQAVNPRLFKQFSNWLPEIALWLWGHEHNQVIYAPFMGLQKGRCVGASAIPVAGTETLYQVDKAFLGPNGAPNQPLPTLLNNAPALRLAVDANRGLYNLGYALLTLDNQNATIDYYQYDSSANTATVMFTEKL